MHQTFKLTRSIDRNHHQSADIASRAAVQGANWLTDDRSYREQAKARAVFDSSERLQLARWEDWGRRAATRAAWRRGPGRGRRTRSSSPTSTSTAAMAAGGLSPSEPVHMHLHIFALTSCLIICSLYLINHICAGLNRCCKSCRLRWINYLRPDIKRGNFTPEEEQAIITLHSVLGNKYVHQNLSS